MTFRSSINSNKRLRDNYLISEFDDRRTILQNSIKVLEMILRNLRNQNETLSLNNIQKRINTYKQKLLMHKKILA